jgi:hypothetical protein
MQTKPQITSKIPNHILQFKNDLQIFWCVWVERGGAAGVAEERDKSTRQNKSTLNLALFLTFFFLPF